VVQPDFSVIVIGTNPTAVAELAPFCERAKRGGSQGAMILKITRESVIKAVGHGLAPAQIIERLQRHASHEVPANVLHEVRDWSNWVRRVTPATITVLRCPDRDTADRVMGALKRQAEQLSDTVVSIGLTKLTAAERNKLRAQGIIVD
jgi:Helicase conserved C-terminal domain